MIAFLEVEEIVKEVWSKITNFSNEQILPYSLEKIKPYEIIVAAPTAKNLDLKEYIGFAVQVRKGVGFMGSDTVLIVGIDGGLSTWEYQSFLKLNQEQLQKMKPLFNDLIVSHMENSSKGYDIKGKDHRVGFLIKQ